jgi:predicted secreted protein
LAKVAGTKGYVKDTASTVTGINQWTLDYTVDMLETTDFSASGVAAYIPGVSRWSGSFSGFKDGAPRALGVTDSVSIVLGEAPTTNWSGMAYISGIHPSTNFDGIVAYSYDFQGTGALNTATA